MKPLKIFEYENWRPLASIGFDNPLFSIHIKTVVCTWIVIVFLVIISLIARYFLKKPESVGNFLVVSFGEAFIDLCNQILGTFRYRHFAFITSLFSFIVLCNFISIIPWLEEPTQDLNTTLALGIAAFLYVHAHAIQVHGLWEYTKEYFSPFILMFPLNVVGKLANVVSISFRLFGNIFGGGVIAQIYHNVIDGSVVWESIGILSGVNLTITIFFGLFEGFIQAFVFSMLALTYLAIAIQTEEIEEVNS